MAEKHRVVERLTHIEQRQHIVDGGVYAKGEVKFEQAEESMSLAVIQAVADREQTAPVSLSLTNVAIAPDAVNVLFLPTAKVYPRAESVTFMYHGYLVTISKEGGRSLHFLD